MFGKKSYVGVDLGQHSIKVAQVDRFAGGWKVTRAGLMPTPKDCVREGIITNPEPVAVGVKALLRQTGISAKSAVTSVQGSTVVVRTVRMPRMTEHVLRKSIRFEAGKYVPTSVEESFVEFAILGRDAGEGQMDVLLVASPKDFVNSRQLALEMAGLEVEVVDVSPFAAYRSLIETDEVRPWSDETFALIDLGAGSNTVSVVSQDVFAMTRTVGAGTGAALTEALRTFFDLTHDEAEQGKSVLNVRDLLDDKPTDHPPLRVLHPYLDELVREIRRSINYYESQQTEVEPVKPVKSVVLTGGGAKLGGIDEFLSAKLGLPVARLGTFDNPRMTNGTSQDLGSGLEYGVAAGLALRAVLSAA